MASLERPDGSDPGSLREVAHDFNNTLQVLVGNLELLRRHIDEEKKVPLSGSTLIRPVEAAINAARQSLELGERLIDIARESEKR